MPKDFFTPRILWERRKSLLPAVAMVIVASFGVGKTTAKAIDAYDLVYVDHLRLDAGEVREIRLEQKIDDIRDFLRVPRRHNYAGE